MFELKEIATAPMPAMICTQCKVEIGAVSPPLCYRCALAAAATYARIATQPLPAEIGDYKAAKIYERLQLAVGFVRDLHPGLAAELQHMATTLRFTTTVSVLPGFDIRDVLFRADRHELRAADGTFGHPDLDMFCTDADGALRDPKDEGCINTRLVRAAGYEIQFVSMDGEFLEDHPVQKAYDEGNGFAGWEPTPPAGDGWQLVGVWDSEDSPVATFVQKLPKPEAPPVVAWYFVDYRYNTKGTQILMVDRAQAELAADKAKTLAVPLIVAPDGATP